MDAGESTARNDQVDEVVDYYKLLEVDENATADELKVHHALSEDLLWFTIRTRILMTLKVLRSDLRPCNRYEVLSDEQERAWYDSHKASLEPEPDAVTVFEDICKGAPPPRARDRGLTVRHLARFFDTTIWSGFADDDNGIFTMYRNLFNRLKAEEAMIPIMNCFLSDIPLELGHPFRRAKTCPQHGHFTTLVEKDNKKARDDARRDYNDTVRSLAKFLRERDPRYRAHLAQQPEENQSRVASGTFTPYTGSSRRATVDSYVEQDWQKIDTQGAHDDDLKWAIGESEGPEEWECVVCGKSFRSEASWNSHERSEKHLKEVERLRREMQEEDVELGLDAPEPGADRFFRRDNLRAWQWERRICTARQGFIVSFLSVIFLFVRAALALTTVT
ncbi:hypothetical protein EDD85DRAFT_1009348 [Armillaria nabsnona]|nr:hypothetical protein EDD85DRAFT_1009348 [Armillaria nabsnona]